MKRVSSEWRARAAQLCENLPFDRLGTDRRTKGKIRGEGGRAMGGLIILGQQEEVIVPSNICYAKSHMSLFFAQEMFLPRLKFALSRCMPKLASTRSHMHGAVVKVHWAKEGGKEMGGRRGWRNMKGSKFEEETREGEVGRVHDLVLESDHVKCSYLIF